MDYVLGARIYWETKNILSPYNIERKPHKKKPTQDYFLYLNFRIDIDTIMHKQWEQT